MYYDFNFGRTSSVSEEVTALAVGIILMIVLFSLAVAVVQIIGQWKTLTKANKPGWGAIIPFYNTYLFCEIAGINPWWILIVLLSPILMVIPILGWLASMAISIYFSILLGVSVARSFGKSDGFAVGLILLPPVFYMILGFGNSEYVGPKPMHDILFDEMLNKNNNDTVNTGDTAKATKGTKFCSNCGNKVDSKSSFCSSCGKKIK